MEKKNMKKENRIMRMLNSQSGEFGIKQIAATVGVIVVIGFAITAIQGKMPGWVDSLWDMFKDKLDTMIQ